jgi:DNA replication and repair protein RecF
MASQNLPPSSPIRPAVRRLQLTDFRSYPSLDLAIDTPMVVLTGDNGAGKTNLLEALSFLTAGRGLRRPELAECAASQGSGGWAISVDLETDAGPVRLGTGIDPPNGSGGPLRRYRIDREPVASIKTFADHVRVVWLTPTMDRLFAGSAGDRRRFLDRLVLAIDSEHGGRVTSLERALRNRNRLLEDYHQRPEAKWLDAVEREIAELAVAVAAARHETIARLSALLGFMPSEDTAFPLPALALEGDIEALVGTRPALEVEDHYRMVLRDQRSRDAAAGRTLIGPHASDLNVRYAAKNLDAAQASTGEQKALLITIALAHAQLVAEMSGIAPIILLDEIAAHLDPARRIALFSALVNLHAQVWMTGADPLAFADVPATAQILKVTPGLVTIYPQLPRNSPL